jgi:hypothetical protein
MKVLSIEENEDGSNLVSLDLSMEEAQRLMEIGFISLLEDAIAADRKRRRTPALFQKAEKAGCSD